MKTVIEIWESGDMTEIRRCREHLQNCNDSQYRIIHRTPQALERYFRFHSEKDGYSFHPKRYEHDGYIYILEMLKEA